jgi:hypothetical protein
MTSPKHEVQPVTLLTAATAASPTSREAQQWMQQMRAIFRAPSPVVLAQMPMNHADQKPRSHALQLPASSRLCLTHHRSCGKTPQRREVRPVVLQMAANAVNPTSHAAQQP